METTGLLSRTAPPAILDIALVDGATGDVTFTSDVTTTYFPSVLLTITSSPSGLAHRWLVDPCGVATKPRSFENTLCPMYSAPPPQRYYIPLSCQNPPYRLGHLTNSDPNLTKAELTGLVAKQHRSFMIALITFTGESFTFRDPYYGS